MAGKLREKRIGFTLAWGLLALVVAAVLLGGSGDSVEAKKYGKRHYHYKKPSYKAQIGKCKSACAHTAATIRGCENQGKKGLLRNCRTTFKSNLSDCAGDGQCKVGAKKALKACLGNARRGGTSSSYLKTESRYCGRCCQRQQGSLSCISAFSSNPFYGAYKKYGKLRCPTGGGGSPSGAFIDISDRIRHGLARLVPWAVDGWSD